MVTADSPHPSRAIEDYLARLELALRRADPALAHDALIDAEQHLRAAVRAGQAPEAAVADYGTPEEVASAYGHAPTREPERPAWQPGRQAPKLRRWRDVPVIGVWADRRAWGALLYFGAVGFLLSLGYFVWAVTLGSLAIGCSAVIIGIPLFVLLLGSARAICLFEGKVVEVLLGVRMPRRTQPVAGADSVGFWGRILCWLRDVRSWLSLAYLLGNFPVSACTFAITVALASVSLSLTLVPIASGLGFLSAMRLTGDGDVRVSILWWDLVPDANGVVTLPMGASIAMLLVGLALATATLWLMRGLGWVYGHVVQAIQVARPQLASPMRSAPPVNRQNT